MVLPATCVTTAGTSTFVESRSWKVVFDTVPAPMASLKVTERGSERPTSVLPVAGMVPDHGGRRRIDDRGVFEHDINPIVGRIEALVRKRSRTVMENPVSAAGALRQGVERSIVKTLGGKVVDIGRIVAGVRVI